MLQYYIALCLNEHIQFDQIHIKFLVADSFQCVCHTPILLIVKDKILWLRINPTSVTEKTQPIWLWQYNHTSQIIQVKGGLGVDKANGSLRILVFLIRSCGLPHRNPRQKLQGECLNFTKRKNPERGYDMGQTISVRTTRLRCHRCLSRGKLKVVYQGGGL